ncbi:MAG: AI-2E family transporter [Rhodocyclaceae bacterium]|nr:AI-2E family transporter [Rhodocyclaceae bacterium]
MPPLSPWLLPVFALAAALWLLGDVLTPFILAGVLAYIFEPVVVCLHARRVPRGAAAAAVLVLLVTALAGLVLLVLPLLLAQTAALAERLPHMVVRVHQQLPALLERFGAVVPAGLGDATAGGDPLAGLQQMLASHAGQISGWLRSGLLRAGQGGAALAGLFGTLVLFPVVLFYALRDLPRIGPALLGLVPAPLRGVVAELAGDADKVLGEFVRGQLAVTVCMAVVYALALHLLGVPHALSIGVLAGILTFVPLLGPVGGALLALGAAALLPGDAAPWWAIVAVFVCGNLLENLLITPWLVGERIGLHPLTVIFALLAFGKLFGFSGVLAALPATAVLQAWLRRWQASASRT